MRITQVMLSSAGGIGTHVRDLAEHLLRQGHDVRVVSDPATLERFAPPGPVPVGRRRSHEVRRALADAEVVHAHGFRAALLARVLTSHRVPLVVSLHNDLGGGEGLRARAGTWTARRVLGRADLVTGASADLVAVAQALGARRAVLAEVPSPRVPALLEEPPPTPGERAAAADALLGTPDRPGLPLVLSIARLAPQKDLGTLVAAAARTRTAARWVVVGDGDREIAAALSRRAAELAAPVTLAGPQDEIGRWLRAASVLVVTSRWEARALVVQEALAAGTPVVATDVGGLPELLAGVGALVPPADPAAVAAAVDALLADPALAQERAAAGRERAAGWDDLEESARRWLVRYSTLRP